MINKPTTLLDDRFTTTDCYNEVNATIERRINFIIAYIDSRIVCASTGADIATCNQVADLKLQARKLLTEAKAYCSKATRLADQQQG